jgi:hypothetical protein
MGGYGSGRWGTNDAKTLVEDCRILDLTQFVREKIVRPGVWRNGQCTWSRDGEQVASIGYTAETWTDSGNLRLKYTVGRDDDRRSLDYKVPLVTTRLCSGGRRWWFRCVASRDNGPTCGRRAAKLYLPPAGWIFACRSCYDLAYTSSRESRKWDGMYRQLAADTGLSFQTVKRTMRNW